jgi:predicted N-acetyltransferase YhbS
VGDPEYYKRVGFSQVEPGLLTMPGPVDINRLMWLELKPGALNDVSGLISPAITG